MLIRSYTNLNIAYMRNSITDYCIQQAHWLTFTICTTEELVDMRPSSYCGAYAPFPSVKPVRVNTKEPNASLLFISTGTL